MSGVTDVPAYRAPADATPEDHLAVCDTLYRFAQGMDWRDWELFRSVFTDVIDIDYSAHRPGQVGQIPADQWVDNARRRLTPLDATQHSMSNPRVMVEADEARCLMYVEAQHLVTRDGLQTSYIIGGRYRDRLVRKDGGWLISGLTLEARWYVGDRSVLGLPPADPEP
jgi:3-phenylpropionate/cinnamic acid dioxygenase small subunit